MTSCAIQPTTLASSTSCPRFHSNRFSGTLRTTRTHSSKSASSMLAFRRASDPVAQVLVVSFLALSVDRSSW